MNDLTGADFAVIIGFFVVMVSIGFYFKSRVKNMSDFFGGGKQVPWWLGGISFYMCSFSALGFVMYSALAYKYGWVSVTIYWTVVPAMILGATFFASRWRRIAETSPLEYIEHRFSNYMRQGLVWLGIPTRLIDDGLKLFAIGTVVSVGLGFPLKWAIIGSGIIMISYTFLGGLWAALVADFIQFAVLIAAVVVLPFLAFQKVGGVASFIEQAPEGFFKLVSADYGWRYLSFFFVITLLSYSTSWALVQRYYSASSDKDARKVGYLVALLSFIGPPVFYIPAMVARVLIPNIENTNEVYAIVCKTVLPVGMLGMVIAAMFSATMSTLAGDFNAVASVLTNDVYKRMLAKKASSTSLLTVGRVNTLIVGLLVISITLLIQAAQGSKDLFDIMVKVFGLFLPPVALPMLLGMLNKRISNTGGLLGLILGITAGLCVFIISTFLSDSYPVLKNLMKTEVITSVTSLTTIVGMIGGSLLCPDELRQGQKVDEFFIKINNPSTLQTAKESGIQKPTSPFSVIGIGIGAIGIILTVSVVVSESSQKLTLSIYVGLCMIVTGLTFWLVDYCKKRK